MTATEIEAKRDEIRARAWAAVDIDDHPDGRAIAEKVSRCSPPMAKRCRQQSDALERESRAAVSAGWAILFANANEEPIEKILATAEHFVEEAEKDAERDGPPRKQRREREAREKAAIDAAVDGCLKDRNSCQKPCEQDEDETACSAYGLVLASEQKWDEAKALFARICEARSIALACDYGKRLEKAREETEAKVEAAWSSLAGIADEIATKKFLLAFAQQHLSGSRNAAATERMRTHVASMIRDEYCPARAAFLDVSFAPELAKRAKAHCADSPPSSTGLNGREEILTAECSQVFATTCP